MADDEDEFDDFEDDAEDGASLGFENQIADEPLAPPPKRFFRMKVLSFSFVALLLLLVALFNLAMILWFLSH